MILTKKDMIKENAKITWCGGCTYHNIFGLMAEALNRAGKRKKDIVAFSGIGCFGRIGNLLNFKRTCHTEHGRAIPAAIGYKLTADVDRYLTDTDFLTALVFGGDGDIVTMGGNHLIQAARENRNLTVICANNSRYAMTGNQSSATTAHGEKRVSQPYGNLSYAFDLASLVTGAGGTFVGRGVLTPKNKNYETYFNQAAELLAEGMNHDGFSFIELISPCIRWEKKRIREALDDILKNCIMVEKDIVTYDSRSRFAYARAMERLEVLGKEDQIMLGKLFHNIGKSSSNKNYLNLVKQQKKDIALVADEYFKLR